MEDKINEAARRTAINLMRLTEAIEMDDASNYSLNTDKHDRSARTARHDQLAFFYRSWFRSQAK